MTLEHQGQDQTTVSELLTQILIDLQHLADQQIQLTKSEIVDELNQRSAGMRLYLLAFCLIFLAAMNASLGLVHIVHWLVSSSGTDSTGIPLWCCHAVVSLTLAVAGWALASLARKRFEAIT